MITARQLARALGRKNLHDNLGVGMTAISNAVVRGWFPTTWFLVMDRMAADAGIECPPALFKMREGQNTQVVDNGADCKVGVAEGGAA